MSVRWGIVPAAGHGTRIQPLAFSKELLPVGSREDAQGEHPKAVSEYLIERLLLAGATRLCVVISPGKYDILQYYGARIGGADIAYVVQPRPAGLCDALFRARPLIGADDTVAIGLPDTIWFPEDGLRQLPPDRIALLLFPVEHPEFFDAVITDARQRVVSIEVKARKASSKWIWGALTMPGRMFHDLHELWRARGAADEYLGTLLNAWIALGGEALGVPSGEGYVDVGTLHGYREAIRLLAAGAGRADRRASG